MKKNKIKRLQHFYTALSQQYAEAELKAMKKIELKKMN